MSTHAVVAALIASLVVGCVPTPASPSGTGGAEPPHPTDGVLGPVGVPGAFHLDFADEFDGTSLGPAWYPNRWFATTCSAGAGADELQFYTRRSTNVSVSGGNLRLTARRELYACGEWGGSRQFTSGWVQTGGSRDVGGVNARPGATCSVGCVVEVRVRIDGGAQTFPAVWLLPVDESGPTTRYPSRPEIDAVEHYRSWTSWEHHIHTECEDGPVDAGRSHAGPDLTAGFHTVAVHWRSPQRIDWFVDGRLSWSYTGCGIPSPGDEMYVILNHAVGGAAPDPPLTEQFPKEMLVDYVRIWSEHAHG